MLKTFFETEVDSRGNPLPLSERTNHKLFVGGEVDLGIEEFFFTTFKDWLWWWNKTSSSVSSY